MNLTLRSTGLVKSSPTTFPLLSRPNRIITHTATSPVEVKVGGESKWICTCGLSKNGPFCDGSHKATKSEEAGKTYRYLPDGTRSEVRIPRP